MFVTLVRGEACSHPDTKKDLKILEMLMNRMTSQRILDDRNLQKLLTALICSAFR